MNTRFPVNPDNGTIFEEQSGVFYIYDISTKSWSRIEGGNIPGVATPISDGLMSSGDFAKLNRLVIPPPQTTLTSADCDLKFNKGIISFSGGDQFFTIGGIEKRDDFIRANQRAMLVNEAAGIDDDNAVEVDRQMHLHTHSFNFEVNVKNLFEFMSDNGKFRVTAQQGPRGPTGDKGEDGKDELNYGPDGDQGEAGANAPFDGSLFAETIPFQKKKLSHRAIVDLSAERVSENENYLVVTRANIGNPNACPDKIRLGADSGTTWLLCFSDVSNIPKYAVNDCLLCVPDIYYVDVQPILDSIQAWKALLLGGLP
jgi:hypothetical protein